MSHLASVTGGLIVNPYGMLIACRCSQMEIISVIMNVLMYVVLAGIVVVIFNIQAISLSLILKLSGNCKDV